MTSFLLGIIFLISNIAAALGSAEIADSDNKMKVVIIGGGAAGLCAALSASARGATG